MCIYASELLWWDIYCVGVLGYQPNGKARHFPNIKVNFLIYVFPVRTTHSSSLSGHIVGPVSRPRLYEPTYVCPIAMRMTAMAAALVDLLPFRGILTRRVHASGLVSFRFGYLVVVLTLVRRGMRSLFFPAAESKVSARVST